MAALLEVDWEITAKTAVDEDKHTGDTGSRDIILVDKPWDTA